MEIVSILILCNTNLISTKILETHTKIKCFYLIAEIFFIYTIYSLSKKSLHRRKKNVKFDFNSRIPTIKSLNTFFIFFLHIL